MGTVWRAHHLSLQCPVALKLINPAIAIDPHAVERFLREARTAAALRSLHVVQILDYGVDGDTPYIAMEMLDGESLAERLKRDGISSLAETARVIRHVSRALTRAHEAGIVHRDLKPENIFIVKNDDDAVIKVLDFGIAKTMTTRFDTSKASMRTRTGSVMGTPHFMSPEQADGVVAVDYRADLWALGVIAFECLLGKLPFTGDSLTRITLAICSDPLPVPSEIGPVPSGFDDWFARACARDPAARFNSAKEAADAFNQLERGAGGAPASQRTPQPSPSVEAAEPALDIEANELGLQVTLRAARRRRLVKTASIALFGATLVGAAVGLGRGWLQGVPVAAPAREQHALSPARQQRLDPQLTLAPTPEAPAREHSAVRAQPEASQQPVAMEDRAGAARVDSKTQPGKTPKHTKRAAKSKKRLPRRTENAEKAPLPSSKVPSVADLGI